LARGRNRRILTRHAYDEIVSSLSVVVVSYNSELFLERCLDAVAGRGHDVVVVDNASQDGSVELVRRRFPDVRVLELESNVGYGTANDAGFEVTTSDYVLVLNPDAWPLGDAVERLAEAADVSPWAAVIGPRLLTSDGEPHHTVRGFPTLWRLATEYFFLRWLAPNSRAMNAFYGGGIDTSRHGAVEWVVGAAILVRRAAFDEVGGFDTHFFMFDEEVDLCYRLRELGWEVLYDPHAEFVHVGGGSTGADRSALYREQLRSHIRFLDKHRGRRAASRGRTMLLWAMRLRSLVLHGERRRISVHAARWLGRLDVEQLLQNGRAARGRVTLHRE
jgi:GT2 family glycosyltransferase